uniref:Peroxidase n=1 Tax=Populus trichocarpa TaxID=3694 RepID=W8Q7Q6_POPTR|nr:class III peroxidase [Populus trichocarpa]
MLTSIFGIGNMRKLSLLVLILCILISVKNQNAEIKKSSSSSKTAVKWPYSSWDSFPSVFLSPLTSMEDDDGEVSWHSNRSLEYDFYRDSCPEAERIIRRVVHELYEVNSSVAPALLRLVFHDCFIEGCDASILLDAATGIDSEKDSPPNKNLKGFDIIDKIKSEIEMVCPGVVSCADIVALAGREGVVQAGGPFYPLYTGRRDAMHSFRDVATSELPSPNADLSETLASFASRGFDLRETVSLLGGHSIGVIHCKFFQNRLYNFGRTNKPDPSLDTGFLNLLRSRCNDRMNMAYEGPGVDFGTLYYRSLLQGKGILYSDQQLMAGIDTGIWVRAYASDISLFPRDFALAMMKLSNLRVLTGSKGQVRLHCSKVA